MTPPYAISRQAGEQYAKIAADHPDDYSATLPGFCDRTARKFDGVKRDSSLADLARVARLSDRMPPQKTLIVP